MQFQLFTRVSVLVIGSIVFQKTTAQTLPPYNIMPVNYVRSWNVTKPVTDASTLNLAAVLRDAQITTQYVDGLGRPLQTVVKQASFPTGGTAVDLIAPSVYDQFGRESTKYLPYAGAEGNGVFKYNPFQEQVNFYNESINSNSPLKGQNESVFYSKTEYEPSPLSRVTKTMAAGNSWAGNNVGVSVLYLSNTETDAVRIWTVTDVAESFGAYSNLNAATYPAGKLSKTVTIDETGKQVIEFKDMDGKVLLKKVQLTATPNNTLGNNHSGWLNTYYIYDKFQRLRAVLQPDAVEKLDPASSTSSLNWTINSQMLDELVFRYEYDGRGRMIMKKVPGAGAVYMVYDVRDRLVLTQDANMRTSNQWLATLYDELNRPVMTGFTTYSGSFANLRTLVTQQTSTSSSSSTVENDPILTTLTSGLKVARNSITMDNGFESKTEFTAEITGIGAESGETTLIDGVAVHQNPLPDGSNFSMLTQTHYDNYTDLPSGLTATLAPSGYASYLTASSASPEYAEAIASSTSTKGMVVWTKAKVLNTENQFIATANIYDSKGRVIQTQTVNQTGGVDVVTNQYSFSGQLLRNHIKHQKLGGTAQSYELATRNNYDDLGRPVSIEKNINNGGWKTISSLSYDALGQLQLKKLGTDPSNTANPLEQLSYSYNIRGWLLGVNKNEVLNANGSSSRKFGFELGYDKLTNTAGRNYVSAQYNGNISGMIWKSAGDGIRRKYDFSYDNANRLMQGLFEQHDDGGSWGNSTVNCTMKMGDGTLDPTKAYDPNGNIIRMQQWGLKGLSSTQIDNLTYSYFNGGNKLQAVSDGIAADNRLGDFTDKNTAATDYGYDNNGNLVTDKNKRINGTTGIDLASGGAITYNYLNLPARIAVQDDAGNAKGSIEYVYDATGIKLKKIVHETGKADKTTLYLLGTYEDDVLQFLPQEEGRIRPLRDANGAVTGFTYDYFIKDHLGNVRMVLTEEQKQDMYPAATMETASVATEEALYSKLPETRVDKPSGYPTDPYLDPNGKVAKVRGDGQKIGPGIVLKVMSGDKINLRVSSWWKSNGVTPNPTPANPLTDLVNALSGGIVPLAEGKITSTDLQGSTSFNSQAQGFLNSRTYTTTKPKAYVQWVFFDEQFKYVSTGSSFEQVGTDGQLTTHTRNGLAVPKNGYVYVYVSNETTNLDVFFDNLQVTHIHGPLLEETHYYPFGLTMAGISSKAAGMLENKRKYNGGTELNSDFDVSLYETNYRSLDPQLGRFWQIDPMADLALSYSPYTYANDNPILLNDPLGLLSDSAHKAITLDNVTVTGYRKSPPLYQQFLNWFNGKNVGYNGAGWGHGPRRWLANQFNLGNTASNLIELGMHSQLQSNQVNLNGGLLDKVKQDAAMVAFQNKIIKALKADPRFKKLGFKLSNKQVVEFGGKRWSSENENWGSLDGNNPALHGETWQVAGNELTWALRHATVEYTAIVKSDGTAVISYHLSDGLDLSSQGGRSDAYNNISKATGFLYHNVAGGNSSMQVNANWQTIVK